MSRDPRYPDAPRQGTYQIGLEFQDFVCRELAREHIILQNTCSKKWQIEVGENLQGFEIKFDARCSDTGRLSIEVAEKARDLPLAPWVPSGIMRGDNTWLYIQGNYQTLYIFAKNWLRRWYTEKSPETEEKFGTIRTFYLKTEVAEVMAARVIRPDCAAIGPGRQRPAAGGAYMRRANGVHERAAQSGQTQPCDRGPS